MSRAGLSQIINDFFLALGFELPAWSGIFLALIVFMLFLPWFIRNARTSRARKLFKKSVYLSGDDREQAQNSAIELVRNNPQGLLSLAELAHQMRLFTLSNQLLDKISHKPKLKREIRLLRQKMEPRGELTPESAAVAVRNLRKEGLEAAANERLVRAIKRWPDSMELQELSRSISQPLK